MKKVTENFKSTEARKKVMFEFPLDNNCNSNENNTYDVYKATRYLKTAKLKEGDAIGEVTNVKAEEMPPRDYPKLWTRITIEFTVTDDETGEEAIARFMASNNLTPNSRMYPIVEGILGDIPDDFNFMELVGQKAIVTIKHRIDEHGSVWDNVVATRPFTERA